MRYLRLFSSVFALVLIVSAAAQRQTNEFALTVKLKARYDPKPTLCMLIRTGEVFVTVMTTGKTKTVVSGKLQDATNEVFPLELDIEQGDHHFTSVADRLIYEMHLGVPEHPSIVEMSNHPPGYDREVSLARGTCEGP